MSPHSFLRFVVIPAAMVGFRSAAADDSTALMNALIRKGILTRIEADEIRAEVNTETSAIPVPALAGGKHTEHLSIGMRMQMQYANLDADVRNAAAGPEATNHAFLRRMYLSLKADLGAAWGAQFTYDFAGSSYDDAIVFWKPDPDLTFDFGLRKVNVAYEERRTSGDLRAIERSGVTRYFVEANNGHRLGAAGYRIGVFLDGKRDLPNAMRLIYGAAITTPERTETFAHASSSGDRTNNQLAGWGDVGLTGKFAADHGSWLIGAGAGFLPDQGGTGVTNLGKGHDLTLYSIHTDITTGRFGLLAEYLTADVQGGRPDLGNARPRGFFVQPSLRLTDRVEAVLRYQWLDSDGRGVSLADVIRSAPSGGTMNAFTEWYAGLNWYLRGDALKFQAGAIQGETRDTVMRAPATARTVGARSQLQMQF